MKRAFSQVDDSNQDDDDLMEITPFIHEKQVEIAAVEVGEESGGAMEEVGTLGDQEIEQEDLLAGAQLPPSKEITVAVKEEQEGRVDFCVVRNDSTDRSMILLTGLRTIFQKQLPNMPKEYIARLVYDRAHCAMVVVRHPLTVLGGLTYKPFMHGQFAEIVFCAIDSNQQVQGYGSRLMSHVKDYVLSAHNCKHFLTYADNYAIGYFKKQGFSTNITLDKSIWMGYIKDYEGGTIMQCSVIDKVKYLDAVSIIAAQRWAVFKKIRDNTLAQKVYPGLKFKEGQTSMDPADIPGLKESGWLPNGQVVAHRSIARQRGPLFIFMKKLIEEAKESTHAWPFVEPVAGVADYYDVIKNPMDLRTLDENVEADKYLTVDSFVDDFNLIWNNCKSYNQDGSNYAKCAKALEKWFKERLKILRIEMKV